MFKLVFKGFDFLFEVGFCFFVKHLLFQFLLLKQLIFLFDFFFQLLKLELQFFVLGFQLLHFLLVLVLLFLH